jgi:hypothetical protein
MEAVVQVSEPGHHEAVLEKARRDAAPDWRVVDRALRTIARRRAELDAEEAGWIREAEALKIWRPLGMVSMLDYLERAMGYSPKTGQERRRVARALGALPQLTAALAAGQLAFSAVRELTRVATPATEAEWIAAAAGKNLRQIEALVADRREGDRPTDPPDPAARRHVVRYELSAETFALLRQARTLLDDEHGTNQSDDAFLAALCGAVIDGAPAAEPTGRAKFQIAVTVCEYCRQGWQEGGGAQIPIGAAAVERALCDAQHIGSIDDDAPARAYQDIPPSVARFVWRRDGGRCRTPGCRSARGLELHHLVHRADGGSHDALNVALICSSCHKAHHEGILTITGTAERIEVRRPGEASVVREACAHVGAAVEPGAELQSSAASSPSRDSAMSDGSAPHVGAAVEPAAEVQSTTASSPRRDSAMSDASCPHVGAAATPSTEVQSSTASSPRRDSGMSDGSGPHVGATVELSAEVQSTTASNPRRDSAMSDGSGPHVGAAAKPSTEVQSSTASRPRRDSAMSDGSGPHVGAAVEPSAEVELPANIGSSIATVESRSLSVHMSAAVEPSAEVQSSTATGARGDSATNDGSRAHLGATVDAGSEVKAAKGDVRAAADLEPARRGDRARVLEEPATELDVAIRRTQTKEALVGLGWKPAIATAAVAAAWVALGSRATFEQLIFEALRQCPRPLATTPRDLRAR